jgi:hypothetical protein
MGGCIQGAVMTVLFFAISAAPGGAALVTETRMTSSAFRAVRTLRLP